MILDALLALAQASGVPPAARQVRAVYLPEPAPDPDRDAEFGLIELACGAAGLYYAWLGEDQRGMAARFPPASLEGRDVLELISASLHADAAARSLAIAGLGALTAAQWQLADYLPPPARNSFGIELRPGTRLGMVGYFPSLVRQARASGIPVTVLERKAHLFKAEPGLRITPDEDALRDCTQIVCTGATLLNDSLTGVLGRCPPAAEVAVVGPTASVFPEPLFERGVSVVGGTLIRAPAEARRLLAAREKLAGCALRYALRPGEFPGTAVLAARVRP